LINDRGLVPDDDPRLKHETLYRGRVRRVQTLFGPVELTRNYYHHAKLGSGRYPVDERLELVGSHTPAVAKLICRASAGSASYQQAGEDLREYAGLGLDHRGFGRLVAATAPELAEALGTLPPTPPPENAVRPEVMYVSCDGTGIPARKEELRGRAGKQPDGSARTREAKLGCVFTQSSFDDEGEPIRDPDSTSYVGTLEGCREAGNLLRQEAYRRGYGRAPTTVYLGDGAAWVWENARLNFPGAVQILDFYHAAEHAGNLARAICGDDTGKAVQCQQRWREKMKRTGARPVIDSARRLVAAHAGVIPPERLGEIETEINYFENNSARMDYGRFREKGYFIGSGVVEAGCKTVIGRRMKQSGMFWSEEGAEKILGLRCLFAGPHFDAAWEARRRIVAENRKKNRRWSTELN